MSKYTLYDYDSSKFPFKETVQSMMDVDQLDMIHEVFEFPEKLEIIKDQNTILHDKFYEEMKKVEFTNLYKDFVSNFISNLEIFKNANLYQKYFLIFFNGYFWGSSLVNFSFWLGWWQGSYFFLLSLIAVKIYQYKKYGI